MNYEMLDVERMKALDRATKMNLKPAVVAQFVCMNIHSDVLWRRSRLCVDVFARTGHVPLSSASLFFCSALLLVLLWLPVQLQHFRKYHEYCISSPVNMIDSFFGFFLLSFLFRGGSLEKDKAVSSSIVSSVQSKITQVLLFAFIPDTSSAEL